MPGLVGLITHAPRARAEAELLRMVAALRHKRTYVSGTWIDESLGLYVGWVEREGTAAAGLPYRNETGDLVLVFSGEEYPEPGAAARLKERGHRVHISDRSYLVHQAEDEPDFLKNLNGRFHGILADRRNGIVTLFNDRYGMHRVYCHESKDSFYFAAEAKAILAVRPELRAVDGRGVAEFISCGCALENRTIFKGISLLPIASAWRFEGKALTREEAYFHPKEWEEQEPLEAEIYYLQLREAFSRDLPRYFSGPGPIGISLTGGLDSRMIMSWADATPGSLSCYSFGGMYRDSQDVKVARKVAGVCGQSHQVIRVGDEFLSEFHDYAERSVFLSDGCVEVKHAPDLYVNEFAAQIAPVRMTGNYGGEVLRRVRAFKPVAPADGLFQPALTRSIEETRQTYQELLSMHPLSFALFRQAPWHHYSLLSLEQSQLAVRSPYLDNDFVQAVFRSPQSLLTNDDVSLRLIADGNPALRSIPTDRGYGGSLPKWAAKMSQGSHEFAFKAEYACDYGMPQSVARFDRLLRPLHWERLFLGRHKFYHYRVWYRDALSGYVRDMLLDPRSLSRPYLQRKAIEDMVQQHTAGTHNHTTAIHKILSLELIHRLFIDAV